jgi:surface antigen
MTTHKASKFTALAVAGALVVGLSGCADTGPKQGVGTLAGAGLGALAGSQIGSGKGKMAAIGVGTLLGAIMGSELGKSLDRADQLAADQASQRALESNRVGQASSWRNPDTGHEGTITPTKTYQNTSGEQCREFTHTVIIGGQSEKAYGTACRQSDGSWKIVS